MLLSVSVAVTLAFSLLVSSTQVPLGESQSVESPAVSSKVHDTQAHSGSVEAAETLTTTSTVVISETEAVIESTTTETKVEANVTNPNPWTSPPFCKTSAISKKEYCVYSNSTFAGGRGISLITTANIADSITSSIAFTDPEFMEGFENDPIGPPHFSKPLPGRGMGVIANRTLQRGHRVFANTAVLIIHRDTAEDLEDADRIELYHRAVDLLPEETRNLFLELHGHVGGDIDKIDDVVITNAFQLYFGDDEEAHNGIIPETSRMNHDCRPNAAYFFDTESLIHFTHAIRPIHPGEEVTVTYTDQTALFEKRQIALDRSWGFTCTCSLCSSPRMIVDESDRRINISREISTALNDWTENSTATVEMAETLVAIYQFERLEAAIGEVYKQAALAYSAVGNLHAAIKYALHAIEYLTLTSGPIDEEVLALQQFVGDPTEHWTWMRRMIKMDDWKNLMDKGRKTAEDSKGTEEESKVKEAEAEEVEEAEEAEEAEATNEGNSAVKEEAAIESEATESEGEPPEAETQKPSRDEL